METMDRKIFCPHCNGMKEHIIMKRIALMIDGDMYVVFLKRCENASNHIRKQIPYRNGFHTDAILAKDWNHLVQNDYL